MACPDCGSSFGEYRNVSSVETHGLDCGPYERFEQEYIVCRQCRGQFDIYEWDSTELSSPDFGSIWRNAAHQTHGLNIGKTEGGDG
jgi:uncharacterized CHY-type Zn-finger protein